MNDICINACSRDGIVLKNMFAGDAVALEEISRINESENRKIFYAFFRMACVFFEPWQSDRIRRDETIQALSDIYTSATGKPRSYDDISQLAERSMFVWIANEIRDTFLDCCEENDFAELYPAVVKRLFEKIKVFERENIHRPQDRPHFLNRVRKILDFSGHQHVEIRGADGEIVSGLSSDAWQKILKEYFCEHVSPEHRPTSYSSFLNGRFRYRGLKFEIVNYDKSAGIETYYDLRENPGSVLIIERFKNGGCREQYYSCANTEYTCRINSKKLHNSLGPAVRHKRKGKPLIEFFYLDDKLVPELNVLGVLSYDQRPVRNYFAPPCRQAPSGQTCG
ncbi:MAG: hypothetical protein PHY92_04145 [Alphaproteobacteria bacterium]|nr:hypothetical protein [Alphaproteobacteria bacterium]